MYRYYVSFAFQAPTSLGMAALDITTRQRITNVEDLSPVYDQLTQQGYRTVTILGFSLYAQEKSASNSRPRTGGDPR